MDKNNIKLLYCILGSILLVLLNSSIFNSALFAIFDNSIGFNSLSMSVDFLKNLLSFIGVVLTAIFSIILIAINSIPIFKQLLSKLFD